MPELPEVETIRRCSPRRSRGVCCASCASWTPAGRSRWRPPRSPTRSSAAGRGARAAGQVLVWRAEGDVHLLIHLRMTGTLLWQPRDEDAAYERVRFDLRRRAAVVLRPAAFRHRRTGRRRSGGRRVLRRAARRRAAERRLHRGVSAGAGARPHRAGEGFLLDQRGSPASGTSTPTRRSSGRASIRCARRARSRAPSATRCATPWSPHSRPASTRAARRSTTSATWTACTAAFSTSSSCTAGAASRVRRAAGDREVRRCGAGNVRRARSASPGRAGGGGVPLRPRRRRSDGGGRRDRRPGSPEAARGARRG